MIKLFVTLCSLAHPDQCLPETMITSSNFEPLQMHDCYAIDKLADWMKKHPTQYIKSWRCQIGDRPERRPV